MIGRLVDGRYRVRARIARGGMATVYVATDLRLERRVALKVMHGHLTDDAVFQSRFIQEARAAARLANPHVVNVFDQGSDAGIAYLVMEYLPGITLRELMREQRRLTVPQTITIMDAALSGLAAAHRAGIVHRDVKPENILLAEDGRIKIGDFGLARATTANTATGQMLLGTIAYLAPELVTRGTADARSDIYALGILLYEMLAGEQPYRGEQPMAIAYQHANDTVPRPSVRNPQVPEQLDELVLWATERNPDDRPDDAQQMLERLREIEREVGITPVAAQATAAVPTVESGGSGELTKVLPGVAEVAAATGASTGVDNGVRLRRRTARRRARGAWLTVLVVLLAALAGGTGWWFGSGPGSMIPIPDVQGLTLEAATAELQEQTLVVAQGEGRYSTEVAVDLVITTDPPPGQRVDKNSTVQVILSLGPRPTSFANGLAGLPEDEALVLLADAGVTVGESDVQFSDQAEGTVLAAVRHPREGGDDVDVSEPGAVVYEGDSANLTVSAGPVPDVAGLSVEDATAELTARELSVAGTDEEFNDGVESGLVIRAVLPEGALRPGDSVRLLVSKGPQPVPVPDVTDLTRDQAKQELEAAGFRYSYSPFWDAVLDGLTRVEGQTPADGSVCDDAGACVPGTTIVLTITGSF